MLGRTLGALLRWETQFFLREKEWRFRLPRGYEAFAEKLAAITQPMPKSWFLLPFNYRSRQGLFAYCDPHVVMIRAIPRKSSIIELFRSSSLSHFKGKFCRKDSGSCLMGQYRREPFGRVMKLIFVNIGLSMSIFGLVFGAYEFITTRNVWALQMTAMFLAVLLFVLTCSYLLKRLGELANRRARDLIYQTLVEITGDAGQNSSRRGEVPGHRAGPGLRLL